jgi:hypothetical protein
MRGTVRNSEVEVDSDILGGTRQGTGDATIRVAENGEEMNGGLAEEKIRKRQQRGKDARGEPSLANATGGTEPNSEDWQTES